MKIAILDDYQNVALKLADWSAVRRRADFCTTIGRMSSFRSYRRATKWYFTPR